MIRNEKEYKEAVNRIREEEDRLAEQEEQLKSMGLSPEEIKRALDPMRSFHQQLEEEVQGYERLRRGEFDEVRNLQGIGQLLVSLRIAKGLTQREFAERLHVHETQVSRDERNEYHGITLDRAARILETLGVEVRSRVEISEKELCA
ncbi:MAG: helix-turn-helix domain-containing protein [Phycisphaerae bacterium]|nr:helix-turn-helix domain-containing protein [Phycisphaerae bacterium]